MNILKLPPTVELIGDVNMGSGGRDVYHLITLHPEEARRKFMKTAVENWALQKAYRPPSHPGALFCTSVRALPHCAWSGNRSWVTITEQRYDN